MTPNYKFNNKKNYFLLSHNSFQNFIISQLRLIILRRTVKTFWRLIEIKSPKIHSFVQPGLTGFVVWGEDLGMLPARTCFTTLLLLIIALNIIEIIETRGCLTQ